MHDFVPWGLGEGEYRSQGAVIIKHSLSQPHHWSHRSETAAPVAVKCDNDSSALPQEMCAWLRTL